MKILIATDKPFAPVAVSGIRKIVTDAGHQLVLLEKYTSKNQLLEAVADVEAAIIRSDIFDNDVFNAAKKLKIVVRAGAGYDNIDLGAATKHNVVAMNTPGQNANAVAELVFGMMLYLARGCFDGRTGTELRGKNIGIHAFGNVGRKVVEIAKGFGMNIYIFDPFKPKTMIESIGGVHAAETLEQLYETSHYVSLHMPATEQTKEMINYSLLSRMPNDGVLINTARKEIICEPDLIRVMDERKGFKYIADVPPDNAKVFEEKYKGRFFFTPKKMGAQTEEANINAGLAAATQICAYFANGDETYRLNFKS